MLFFFFFSSRRRHTRLQGDWSSDVCSSDLAREFSFGRVKLVPAFHGGAVEGDATGQFTTNPCGVVLTMGGRTVYHCGDTGLTMEMQLLAGRVDAMLVPIGDNYTMGVEDAVRAVEFVQPRAV